nr:homeobox-leucine zipper protein HDG5-like isoform X1 [Tanacetum cinerariifolium]
MSAILGALKLVGVVAFAVKHSPDIVLETLGHERTHLEWDVLGGLKNCVQLENIQLAVTLGTTSLLLLSINQWGGGTVGRVKEALAKHQPPSPGGDWPTEKQQVTWVEHTEVIAESPLNQMFYIHLIRTGFAFIAERMVAWLETLLERLSHASLTCATLDRCLQLRLIYLRSNVLITFTGKEIKKKMVNWKILNGIRTHVVLGCLSYDNILDNVYLSECGSEDASYELKGLALKHDKKPRYRPKAAS